MATGETLDRLLPAMNEPPSATAATPDKRNQRLVLDFDDTTDWSAVFPSVMAENYAGGGLTIDIFFMASTATSGDVDWDVSFELVGVSQDTDADNFAAANSINDTAVSATSGIPVKATVTFTDGVDMASITAGDPYRLKITRGAAGETGGIVGDAELLAIHVKET